MYISTIIVELYYYNNSTTLANNNCTSTSWFNISMYSPLVFHAPSIWYADEATPNKKLSGNVYVLKYSAGTLKKYLLILRELISLYHRLTSLHKSQWKAQQLLYACLRCYKQTNVYFAFTICSIFIYTCSKKGISIAIKLVPLLSLYTCLRVSLNLMNFIVGSNYYLVLGISNHHLQILLIRWLKDKHYMI